jgi:hypothetical protein
MSSLNILEEMRAREDKPFLLAKTRGPMFFYDDITVCYPSLLTYLWFCPFPFLKDSHVFQRLFKFGKKENSCDIF